MCAESLANIPRHDQEIVDLRDQGQHEEEQAQRKERDVMTGVIAELNMRSRIAIQGNSAHCEVYAIKQTKPSAQAGPLKAGPVPMAHKELDQGKGPGSVIHFTGSFLLMR